MSLTQSLIYIADHGLGSLSGYRYPSAKIGTVTIGDLDQNLSLSLCDGNNFCTVQCSHRSESESVSINVNKQQHVAIHPYQTVHNRCSSVIKIVCFNN